MTNYIVSTKLLRKGGHVRVNWQKWHAIEANCKDGAIDLVESPSNAQQFGSDLNDLKQVRTQIAKWFAQHGIQINWQRFIVAEYDTAANKVGTLPLNWSPIDHLK
jgi:hypothetical protein